MLILTAMFLIRIVIPTAILLGAGFLYEYLIEKSATRKREQASLPVESQARVRVVTLPPSYVETSEVSHAPPCWEIMACPPERRAVCPAAHRRGVPCWVTMQLLTGQLPGPCLDCGVFKGTTSPDAFQETTLVKE